MSKECLKRALRTFFQTAVGYLAVAVPAIDVRDASAFRTALVGIGVSAAAAGLAAVMNINEE